VQSVTYRRKAFYSQQIVYLLKAKIHYISKIVNVEVLNAKRELDQINGKNTTKKRFYCGKIHDMLSWKHVIICDRWDDIDRDQIVLSILRYVSYHKIPY
jgi:hypothetical protein